MMSRESETAVLCRGGILADEMGLGKTWETIGLMLNNPVRETLILVPPVLQPQWAEALKKSDFPVSILQMGGKWKLQSAGTRSDMNVRLATYDRAARYFSTFESIELDRVIADEGHALRNPNTRRFQTLKRLVAPRRWILSGTPLQNKLDDFSSLLQWMCVNYRAANMNLRETAATLILRRVVADVADRITTFPEFKPVHRVHPVMMAPESKEKQVFDALVRRFQSAQDSQAQNWVVLELYLRIRQFLAHPQIYINAMHKKYKGDYGRAKEWDSTACKMDAFEAIVTKADKRPTIVFTNFKEELRYAEGVLREAGYETWSICGGQNDAIRSAVIRKSQEAVAAGRPAAILIQIVAGNAGINLQHMNRIVFLSSHWNPAVIDQAVARAYRIGQTERVEVHHILLADGAEKNLDRYIAKLHGNKRDIARELHEKLICESAADPKEILRTLNEICPDEADGCVEDEGDEEDEGNEEDEVVKVPVSNEIVGDCNDAAEVSEDPQ